MTIAAWQVEFSIVPRRALTAAGIAPQRPAIASDWWAAEKLPSDYQRKLAAIASPAASSDANRQTWGPEEGNRIDVWFVDGRATRMTARVDVRRLDSKFGAMLLQFARTAGAVLVRGDGLVIEPLVGAFGAALRSSDAWRFANDPAERIALYRDTPPDDE